jgi:hypothetical protein
MCTPYLSAQGSDSTDFRYRRSGVPGGRQLLKSLKNLSEAKSAHVSDGESMPILEDVAFTGVFSDLRKTFPFTTIWSHDNFTGEIIGLLPSREQSEL